MMYMIFILLESLALANFIVAFSGQPLEYRSFSGRHFHGGPEVTPENHRPLLFDNAPADIGPFPELDGRQYLAVKERPIRNRLENALFGKGYDPSEIDDGKNELVPMYNPKMRMVAIPYAITKQKAENTRWQTSMGNNNVSELSERGHGSWRPPVGKSLQQPIPIYPFRFPNAEWNWYLQQPIPIYPFRFPNPEWNWYLQQPIPIYPFRFPNPEWNWYSYAGQPSQPALSLREPLEVKERRIQKLENSIFRKGYDPSKFESWNEIEGGRNESPLITVAPRYDPRMQVAGIPYAHPMPRAQNARRHTIRGDNILEHNWRTPVGQRLQKLIWKPAPTASPFREPIWIHPIRHLKKQEFNDPTADHSFRVLGEQIHFFENGKNDGVLPGQLPREKLIALLLKDLDLERPGLRNLPFFAAKSDWDSKQEHLLHKERKIFESSDKSVYLPRLVNLSVDKDDEMRQETQEEGIPHTWMEILDVPGKFQLRVSKDRTNDVQEKTYPLQTAIMEENLRKREHETRFNEGNQQKSQVQELSGLDTEISQIPILSEELGYTISPGENKELANNGDRNPNINIELHSEKTFKHNEDARKGPCLGDR